MWTLDLVQPYRIQCTCCWLTPTLWEPYIYWTIWQHCHLLVCSYDLVWRGSDNSQHFAFDTMDMWHAQVNIIILHWWIIHFLLPVIVYADTFNRPFYLTYIVCHVPMPYMKFIVVTNSIYKCNLFTVFVFRNNMNALVTRY